MQSRRNFLSKVGVCTLLPFIPNLSFGNKVEEKETLFSRDVTLGFFFSEKKEVMLYAIKGSRKIPHYDNRYELVLPGISSKINTKFVVLNIGCGWKSYPEILIMENTEENWAKLVQDNS